MRGRAQNTGHFPQLLHPRDRGVSEDGSTGWYAALLRSSQVLANVVDLLRSRLQHHQARSTEDGSGRMRLSLNVAPPLRTCSFNSLPSPLPLRSPCMHVCTLPVRETPSRFEGGSSSVSIENGLSRFPLNTRSYTSNILIRRCRFLRHYYVQLDECFTRLRIRIRLLIATGPFVRSPITVTFRLSKFALYILMSRNVTKT